MKKQLATLQQLLVVMDPELYRHLGTFEVILNTRWLMPGSCRENGQLEPVLLLPVLIQAACFNNILTFVRRRWVLISFKREFPFDDVLRLWEVGDFTFDINCP